MYRLLEVPAVIVNEKLELLSAMKFEQIALLPNESSEDVMVAGKKGTLSVWHDLLNADEHRVVVQLYVPGILGVGRMRAEGFVINSRNEKRPLSTEEWSPFS